MDGTMHEQIRSEHVWGSNPDTTETSWSSGSFLGAPRPKGMSIKMANVPPESLCCHQFSLSCETGLLISSPSGQNSYYQVPWFLQSDRKSTAREILLNPTSGLSIHLLGVLARGVVIKHYISVFLPQLDQSSVRGILESLHCGALEETLVLGEGGCSLQEKDMGIGHSPGREGLRYWLLLNFCFSTWIQQKNLAVT